MRTMLRMVLVLALATLPAGCLAAAAAAGAGGAIAYNERGASSLVNRPMDDVAADARAVLSEMGITPEGSGDSDDRVVSGSRGDLRVRVEIEAESGNRSDVMVTAREGTLDYDREMARDILSRIIARG